MKKCIASWISGIEPAELTIFITVKLILSLGPLDS